MTNPNIEIEFPPNADTKFVSTYTGGDAKVFASSSSSSGDSISDIVRGHSFDHLSDPVMLYLMHIRLRDKKKRQFMLPKNLQSESLPSGNSVLDFRPSVLNERTNAEKNQKGYIAFSQQSQQLAAGQVKDVESNYEEFDDRAKATRSYEPLIRRLDRRLKPTEPIAQKQQKKPKKSKKPDYSSDSDD